MDPVTLAAARAAANKALTSQSRKDALRIGAFPKQTGTATVTLGAAGGATTVTSPVGIAGNHAALRFSAVPSTSLVGGVYYTGVTPSPSSLDRGLGYFIDYWIDTANFDHKLYGNATTNGYKLWIDGVAQSADVQAGPASADAQIYRLNINFGTRGIHHIRVLQNGGFTGLVIGPNDSVWAATRPLFRKRAMFLTDSYGNGSGATYPIQGFPWVMSEHLGWEPYLDCQSSTGYTNNAGGSGGRATYINRVSALAAYSPDIVVIEGSLNDDSAGASAVGTAAAALYAAIAAALPSAEVYVFGPQYPNPAAGGSAGRDAIVTAMAAAAAAAPNVKLFSSLSGWITSPGNQTVYTAGDVTHPTAAGHRMYGTRMAEAVAATF